MDDDITWDDSFADDFETFELDRIHDDIGLEALEVDDEDDDTNEGVTLNPHRPACANDCRMVGRLHRLARKHGDEELWAACEAWMLESDFTDLAIALGAAVQDPSLYAAEGVVADVVPCTYPDEELDELGFIDGPELAELAHEIVDSWRRSVRGTERFALFGEDQVDTGVFRDFESGAWQSRYFLDPQSVIDDAWAEPFEVAPCPF